MDQLGGCFESSRDLFLLRFVRYLRGFILHLIGRKTINIPEIFSGVHSFTGKTVKSMLETQLCIPF